MKKSGKSESERIGFDETLGTLVGRNEQILRTPYSPTMGHRDFPLFNNDGDPGVLDRCDFRQPVELAIGIPGRSTLSIYGYSAFSLLGMYTYLSPMLLVYGANEKQYDLHNGTSFDYLLLMRGVKPGMEWQRRLLRFYLEGLLKVVEKLEREELPTSVEVRGSSYFFSESTAQRLGFELKETGGMEKFNIIINYLDLLWMYSLAHGRWRWPNLQGVKTASISGEKLLLAKADLERLYRYLTR